MKKYILFLVFLLTFSLHAQEEQDDEQDDLYALTTASSTVGIGTADVLDPYLSPFVYSGWKVATKYTRRRLLKPENDKLSYSQMGYLDAGVGYHPSRTNSMLFFNTNHNIGLNYHFRPIENLMVLAGGSWDVGLGGNFLGRNVNNPFSLDLYTNLNATAEVQYVFNLWKQDFSVQYGLKSPLVGCMFVPTQGITYYELFLLNNLSAAFHFSSIHNRRGLFHYINVDIPLKRTTIRVHLHHDYLKYQAHDMVFRKSGMGIAVGSVVDLYVFQGKKRKAPTNFIRSYE